MRAALPKGSAVGPAVVLPAQGWQCNCDPSIGIVARIPFVRKLFMLVHEHINLDVSVRVDDGSDPEDSGQPALAVGEVES